MREKVLPQDLLDYIGEHKKELDDGDMFTIATNNDFGVEITLMQDYGDLFIVAYMDNEEVERECITLSDYDEVEEIADDFYRDYIDVVMFPDDEDKAMSRFDACDSIREREEDLDNAFSDLLYVISNGNGMKKMDEKVNELKEVVLKYCADKFSMDIYRPSLIRDEAGNEYYEVHPYRDWDI